MTSALLEKENTPVVHYFTRQWKKMGYNVLVIHYPTNFPWIIMKIASLFKKQLSAMLPATIRTTPAKEFEYINIVLHMFEPRPYFALPARI